MFSMSRQVDAESAHKILSPVTLALLEDSGWYTVDFSKADLVSFGLGAGCSFVEETCIDKVSGTLSSGAKGIFCDNDEFEQCDPSYKSRAYCNMEFNLQLPGEFRYFPEEPFLTGEVAQYDFCPIPIDWIDPCDAGTMCFLRVGEASLCLEARCIENEVVFTYDGNAYTCEFDFQQILVAGLNEMVECPRIAAFCPELGCPGTCSGRGVCDWSKNIPECLCNGNDKSVGCYSEIVDGSFDSDTGGKTSKKGGSRRRRARRAVRVRGHRA